MPEPLRSAVRRLADRLAGWYDEHRRDGWDWFEDQLTYDNARLPQALIAAGSRLGDPDLVRRGVTALDWYTDQCCVDSAAVRLVGNQWRRADDSLAEDEGDEQPVDVAALVEALVEACTQTGGEHYGRQAVHAFEWFLGRNTHGLPVYDFATGGCHDGLGPAGPSENEGRSPPWPTCRRGLRSRAPDCSGSSAARNEVALLGPIAWRTPAGALRPVGADHRTAGRRSGRPRLDVTLFATLDSQTTATLDGVCPQGYEVDRSRDGRVWEALHVGHAFARSASSTWCTTTSTGCRWLSPRTAGHHW